MHDEPAASSRPVPTPRAGNVDLPARPASTGQHGRDRPAPGGRTIADDLGTRFARALAAKDAEALRALLDPEVDFRGLTPGRAWEATGPRAVVDDVLLGHWFEPQDHIDALEDLQQGAVVDRQHLAYRLRVTTPDGPHLVEQQAYYASDGDRITSLRILCSGFRPLSEA